MKKILSIVCMGILVIGFTGCGTTEEQGVKEQTLVCTDTENDEDMSVEQVVSMTYKDDKLNHMTLEVNTKILNSDVKDNWETFKKTMDEQNQEFDKDGISLKVVVDDENYEYNTILNVDMENATEEALKEQGFDEIKDEISSIEDSKESAEKDGATCVIKEN